MGKHLASPYFFINLGSVFFRNHAGQQTPADGYHEPLAAFWGAFKFQPAAIGEAVKMAAVIRNPKLPGLPFKYSRDPNFSTQTKKQTNALGMIMLQCMWGTKR
ncbi:MAG: hypothetical protein ACLFT8_00435 [Desulfovermiculus sp.]